MFVRFDIMFKNINTLKSNFLESLCKHNLSHLMYCMLYSLHQPIEQSRFCSKHFVIDEPIVINPIFMSL